MSAEFEFISELSTADTGGGFVLDLITLKDGRVIAIGEDSVVLYESMKDFEENSARLRPMFEL